MVQLPIDYDVSPVRYPDAVVLTGSMNDVVYGPFDEPVECPVYIFPDAQNDFTKLDGACTVGYPSFNGVSIGGDLGAVVLFLGADVADECFYGSMAFDVAGPRVADPSP